jgi:hypothetical protein
VAAGKSAYFVINLEQFSTSQLIRCFPSFNPLHSRSTWSSLFHIDKPLVTMQTALIRFTFFQTQSNGTFGKRIPTVEPVILWRQFILQVQRCCQETVMILSTWLMLCLIPFFVTLSHVRTLCELQNQNRSSIILK